MLDESILRTKTATNLVMAIENLLKIIPKGVRCPAVFIAENIIKEHNKAIRYACGKNVKGTIISRRERILNYKNDKWL